MQNRFRHGLSVAASATALLWCGDARAQEAAPVPGTVNAPKPGDAAGSKEAAQIVVTGSRLRGVAPVGTNVIGINATDINRQPAANIPDLLRRFPQVAGLGFDEAAKTGLGPGAPSNNTTRTSTVDLRGLGPQATLSLINGERIPLGGALGTVPDPNIIPFIALERIEVVADGASAVYGSDAIAGVVNFITRTRYDGAETRIRYGVTDGQNRLVVSQLVGKDWGSGSVVLAAEYSKEDRLKGIDRDFLRSDLRSLGGHDYRDTQCNPGNIIVGGISYAIPVGGVTPANASALVPGTVNRCENYRLGDILPRTIRQQAYLSAVQDLTDNLQVYLRGTYSHRQYEFNDVVSGSVTETANLTVPSTNAFFVAPPGTNAARETLQYVFVNDIGALPFRGTSETITINGGATWKLPHSWKLGLALNYGVDHDKLNVESINNSALNAALASNNPLTALDPFGLGRTSESVLSGIFTNVFAPFANYTDKIGRVTADGPLFHLSGGDVRLLVGAERFIADTNAGNLRGAPGAQTYTSSTITQTVNSAFGELYIPLVGNANSRRGLDKLELSIAGRIDHYTNIGTTKNPKIGINYRPIRGFLLKGTYGTSFRAPPAGQLANGPAAGLYYVTVPDPLSPTGVSTGLFNNGSNPNLKPETAKTYTLTAQIEPPRIPGLNFSATWFSVEYKQQIISPPAGTLLVDQNQAFRVIRNPTPAEVAAYIAAANLPVIGVAPSVVPFIGDLRPLNQGVTKSQGVDVLSSYAHDSSFGHWAVGFNATFQSKFAVSFGPGKPFIEEKGTIGYVPKFRGRAFANWNLGGFSADAELNYSGNYLNTFVSPAQHVSSYTTLDLGFGYEVKQGPAWIRGLAFTIHGDNVFNRRPPFVDIQGGFDPSVASPVGRIVYFTLSKRF